MGFDLSSLIPTPPLWIVLVLILSYLVWCKFFNENKLYPIKKVDQIFEIFLISLFIFLFIIGLGISFFLSVEILTSNVNLVNLVQTMIPIFVGLIGGSLILCFVIWAFGKEEVEKKDLDKFFRIMFLVYSVPFGFITFYSLFISLFSPIVHVIGSFLTEEIIVLLVIFLFLSSLMGIFNHTLFKDLKRDAHKRKSSLPMIFLIFIASALGILFFFLFTPKIQFNNNLQQISYVTYPSGQSNHEDFIYESVNTSSLHPRFSIPPIFVIDYPKWNFILNPSLPWPNNNPLFLDFLSNGTTKLETRFPFSDINNIYTGYSLKKINVSYDNNSIIIKFDRQELKENKIDSLVLNGLIPVNLSRNFTYYQQTYHNGDNAYITNITFNSWLDLPTEIEGGNIFNYNNPNCNLSEVEISYQVNQGVTQYQNQVCSNNKCGILIHGINKEFPVEIMLDNQGSSGVYRYPIQIDSNISLQMEIDAYAQC